MEEAQGIVTEQIPPKVHRHLKKKKKRVNVAYGAQCEH
jgi:hypothetical protein